MNTVSRKQREIQEREARILEVAGRLLVEDGYLKLNMDRIADEIEYAKGTVYQHFRNKEDIIVALSVAAHQKTAELFRTASGFKGGSRQRATAVGVASVLMNSLYPDSLQIHRVTRNPAILEKAKSERQQQLAASEGACMAVLAEIVRDAEADGDVALPEDIAAEDVVFGMWAMSTGAYEILAAGIPLVEQGVRDPLAALWHNFMRLLDGYGWKPLSVEEDYRTIRARAWRELFADDYPEYEPPWMQEQEA